MQMPDSIDQGMYASEGCGQMSICCHSLQVGTTLSLVLPPLCSARGWVGVETSWRYNITLRVSDVGFVTLSAGDE